MVPSRRGGRIAGSVNEENDDLEVATGELSLAGRIGPFEKGSSGKDEVPKGGAENDGGSGRGAALERG